MRNAVTLVLVSIALTAAFTACKKSGGGGGAPGAAEAIAQMAAFKERVCACKDQACVDQVTMDMTKWAAEHKTGSAGDLSADDQKKLAATSNDIAACVTRIVTDAAAAAAASAAAAGSGSGDAAGSGSAAGGGEAMAHRTGMCPSTVLGATTRSAVKGKTIIVTIESPDRDAIAAIQKRADELLAEKKDARTGDAHDQKGTHGGSRGICPVYVPEGATAVAKHQPKGVVVTITPRDKLDELAGEITSRIPEAASWVKANVKDADKGNQGGVGGGKGEDGSNHSGKGDGKGHERKKGGGAGTGGGGGAGTGGGGGKGTGGGSTKPD